MSDPTDDDDDDISDYESSNYFLEQLVTPLPANRRRISGRRFSPSEKCQGICISERIHTYTLYVKIILKL